MKKKIYFPGLDGLRFITAFFVIILHIEQIKYLFSYPNRWNNPFIFNAGDLAVTMFFVLSGFIITFLLLNEKRFFGRISMKNFYMRRILRIWPLYFFVVSIGLFILPKISFLYMPGLSESMSGNFIYKSILFMLMLPNAVLALGWATPFISQAWSIGVEEQFYLVWPWILRSVKRYLWAMVGIIIVMVGLSNFISFLSWHGGTVFGFSKVSLDVLAFLRNYLWIFRISCMAIGGIGAYILFCRKDKILNVIFRRDVQLLTLILLFILVYNGVYISYVHHEFYSLFFCIIILNVAANEKSILKLSKEPLIFLGKISYGIYMYHLIAIILSINMMRYMNIADFTKVMPNIELYVMSILLTVGISSLSYFLFEKRFLDMKRRFTKITKED
ncbi:hypothetical protein COV19_05375 [Candidatus Woesearchaeota archaeon CG10_big_fil_rev_8_21_14_0_10_44_13]|nr:MAG: hypothetical protein COV19_05375 [Candidatus Woesearchaeota archaeon CG10_big_fil_rev_8_21_14_0_10_44_13]